MAGYAAERKIATFGAGYSGLSRRPKNAFSGIVVQFLPLETVEAVARREHFSGTLAGSVVKTGR